MSRYPNQEAAAWYLAALVDGEGHIGMQANWSKQISVANTDPEIIAACLDALEMLGLKGHVKVGSNKKAKSILFVEGIYTWAGIKTFANLVPVQGRKRIALHEMIETHRIMREDRYPEPPTSEDLRRWYVDEGLSTVQISKLTGRSPFAIGSWLKKAGVQLRGRWPVKEASSR